MSSHIGGMKIGAIMALRGDVAEPLERLILIKIIYLGHFYNQKLPFAYVV